MRPDRIILGEIRGAECFDLLAAMNTGHDGSMCTLHANNPRECLGRMENMILMGDIKIPKEAISRQIAGSVDLIVQVKHLRDGSRRTTQITEVIGMEGDVIVTQDLFKFEYGEEDADGKNTWRMGRRRRPAIHTRKGTAIWFRPAIFRSLLGLKPFNSQCRSQNSAEYGKHGNSRPRDETYVFDIDAFMAAAVRKAANQHH